MATAIVLADEGAGEMLAVLFTAQAQEAHVHLKLYCNNYSPAHDMTTASFTEAAGGNYAQKTLLCTSSGTNWTVNANDPRDVTTAEQTWTFTGALTTNTIIYGYYVTNAAENKVLWAQLFDATFTPANNGDQLKLTPKLQLSKGTPS
jgi:hypothetical protein